MEIILSLTNQLSRLGAAKRTILANNRRVNLETKLPVARHMSRSKFLYLGLPKLCCGVDAIEHVRPPHESHVRVMSLSQSTGVVGFVHLHRVSFHVGRSPIIF